VAEFAAREGGLPESKLVVIPNAVDVELFASATPADLTALGIPGGAPVILFVGRLDEQKDPLLLLESFRLLSPSCPHARLLFAGEGPLAGRLRESAADLGERVRLIGYRRDIPDLLRAASCLALPSRWEGMPNVILEAMAAATPVVATAVEGVAELLADGRLGTVVSDPTPHRFAEALASVLESPTEAAIRGRRSQEVVARRFTTEAMAAAYEQLYEILLGGPASSGPTAPVRGGSQSTRKI
jgi:glycosyltransferase involved in cell wall biosynthesis